MKKRWVLSAIISFLIVAAVYVWSVFYNWGVPYFQHNFSFGGMVLPFIVFFLFATVVLLVVVTAVSNRRAYNRMTEEEKNEYNKKLAQARAQRDAQFKAQVNTAGAQTQPPRTMDNTPKCKKCGSTSLSGNKKGYSLMTGFIGANKVKITCMNCGHQWTAGKK